MDSTIQAISLKVIHFDKHLFNYVQTLKKSFSIKMSDPIVCIESMEKGRSKSLRVLHYILAKLDMDLGILCGPCKYGIENVQRKTTDLLC
jgi:hypothetical protein